MRFLTVLITWAFLVTAGSAAGERTEITFMLCDWDGQVRRSQTVIVPLESADMTPAQLLVASAPDEKAKLYAKLYTRGSVLRYDAQLQTYTVFCAFMDRSEMKTLMSQQHARALARQPPCKVHVGQLKNRDIIVLKMETN
jgi:hypothetical protein